MTVDERWDYVAHLDENLLQGGVCLSEWSACLVRNADVAFVHEAHLACILTAIAAVESHLRHEEGRNGHLSDLIDGSDLSPDLRAELHALRRFRNSWVHVEASSDEAELLSDPDGSEQELADMARRSVVAIRRTLYSNPYV